MVIKNVNIGLLIEQRMNELGMSKSEFARKINMPSQNINRIFARNSIDTDKLILISVALNYDFFKEFTSSDKVSVGNVDHAAVAVGDNATASNERHEQGSHDMVEYLMEQNKSLTSQNATLTEQVSLLLNRVKLRTDQMFDMVQTRFDEQDAMMAADLQTTLDKCSTLDVNAVADTLWRKRG